MRFSLFHLWGVLFLSAITLLSETAIVYAELPEKSIDEAHVIGFRKRFATLEGRGKISPVLQRKKWPKNDSLASYLEMEVLLHPRYRTRSSDIERFFKRWPNHPQSVRIKRLMDKRVTATGSNRQALRWYDTHGARSHKMRVRYMRLLIAKKRYKKAESVWKTAYRTGYPIPTDVFRKMIRRKGVLKAKDHETRARAMVRRGKTGLFNSQLKRIAPKRRTYFKALEAAYTVNGKLFDRLLRKLPAKEYKDSDLWFVRINTLRRKGFRDKATRLLLGTQGGYLSDSHRQKLRFRIGRDLINRKTDFAKAADILEGNVKEKGAVLEDSLWMAAWSNYLANRKVKALGMMETLARDARHFRRRSQGAWWAARILEELGRDGQPWLEKAAQYPDTFYGYLAFERVNGVGAPLPVGKPMVCRIPNGNPIYEKGVKRFKNLIRVRRTYYNGPEIERLSQRLNLDLETQLCIALKYERANQTVRIAELLRSRRLVRWQGLYPRPEWKPLTDWRLDPSLIWATARQESLLLHRVQSRVGAIGLLQLMPATAKEEIRIVGLDPFTRYRMQLPYFNLALGQSYLSRMLGRFEGDLVLALISYNAGPGRALSWRKTRYQHDPILFIESIPFTETRHYVKRVSHAYAIYRALEKRPISLEDAIRPGKPGIHAVRTLKR
ncbi:MAG: lytic transglycosylase domain-containing protein [Magnetococcales bacterium]|nr:lytic transglycosylase domain-containing protein [Magnetococcales bacterium]